MNNLRSESLDERKFIYGNFMNLQKAFENDDHNISRSKLDHYGISGVARNGLKLTYVIENSMCLLMVLNLTPPR